MAIHIVKGKADPDLIVNKIQTLHYMPCKINCEGSANVSKFFQPYVDKQDNDQALNASYRGYPLRGKVIKFPNTYSGVVLKETSNSSASGTPERNLFVTHNFDALTFWNWDKIPTRNDAFITALDWIDVSEALHSTDNEPADEK